MKSPRRFSTEKSPFVPQKASLWAHLLVVRTSSIVNFKSQFLSLLSKSIINLFPFRRMVPVGPGASVSDERIPKNIDFESIDKN